MLMFISFPTIVSEWVELDSMASSLGNDVLSRNTEVNKPYRTQEGYGVFKVSA